MAYLKIMRGYTMLDNSSIFKTVDSHSVFSDQLGHTETSQDFARSVIRHFHLHDVTPVE